MCIYDCYAPVPEVRLLWQTTTYDLKLHLIFIKCALCGERKAKSHVYKVSTDTSLQVLHCVYEKS